MRILHFDSLVRSSVIRQISAIVFCAVMAYVLLMVLRNVLPEYPIGWDSPYYITRAKYLIEQDVLSNRVGLIALLSVVQQVTGLSFVTIQWFVLPFIMFMFALTSGLIASRLHSERNTFFLIVFLFVLWSSAFFVLAVSTADNALGLLLLFFSIFLLQKLQISWKSIASLLILLVGLSLTHIETLSILIAVVFLHVCLRFIQMRDKHAWWNEIRRPLMAFGVATVIAIFQWWDIIGGIIRGYATTADPAGNASIPYATGPTLTAWVGYARTGIERNPESLLFGLGLIAIVWYTWKRQMAATAVFSYVIVAYSVLAYSVINGSIPINRSILILPTAWLAGIGLALSLNTTKRWPKIFPLVALLVGVGLFAWMPVRFQTYARGFPISIQASTYQGFTDLAAYVKDQQINTFVIVTNTNPDERAASAYYGLWTNWKLSLLPLPTETLGSCVYVGTIENYLNGKPTSRVTNAEYSEISNFTLECIRALPTSPVTFVIPSLYPSSIASNRRYRLEPITDYLIRVDGARIAP